MSDQRDNGIAWTDETWNPLRGCSKVSAGCKHCYAETMAARFSGPGQPYDGTITNSRWNGNIRLVAEKLAEPLRWRRPRRIFVNSMSDLFHEGVPFEYVAAVFGVMAACPQHTFQVLTKRPERAVGFFKWLAVEAIGLPGGMIAHCVFAAIGAKTSGAPSIRAALNPWPLPNVWIGVSVEDQATADARIPLLIQCPAAVRWVSYEPALGPVDFAAFLSVNWDVFVGPCGCSEMRDPWTRCANCIHVLQWIVIGGESGANARPFDVAWARAVIEQGRAAGVPVFVKQLGAKPRGICGWEHHDAEPPDWLDKDGTLAYGVRHPGDVVVPGAGPPDDLCHHRDDAWWPCQPNLRDRAGADPSEWPEDLRVRECPHAAE